MAVNLKYQKIHLNYYREGNFLIDFLFCCHLTTAFHPVSPWLCLMIGDAQADIDAAQDNDIDFIFRRHKENLKLNINTNIQTIENFNEL